MEALFKRQIETHYPEIGEIQSREEVHGGYLSHNTKIITHVGEYFLKIVRPKVGDRIDEILEMELLCKVNGIPVMLPIKNSFNKYSSIIDGRTIMLYHFLNNETFDSGNLSDVKIASMMKTLARIHMIPITGGEKIPGDSVMGKLNKEKSRDKFEIITNHIQENDWSNDEFIPTVLESIQIKSTFINNFVETWEPEGFGRVVLTHGDYHSRNVFFDEHEQVSHVFDFEQAEYNYEAFELIRAVRILCFQYDVGDSEIHMAQYAINEYMKSNPKPKGVIINALRYSFSRLFFDGWVEGEHVLFKNSKVDHFVVSLMPVYKELAVNMEEIIQKICINI